MPTRITLFSPGPWFALSVCVCAVLAWEYKSRELSLQERAIRVLELQATTPTPPLKYWEGVK